VVGLTDSNGNEVNAYDYDPYGVMLNETQGQPNPFQYEGGYFESSTGLVKFGTRYYNPQLGRWTQQDPKAGSLGNPDTLNRYLYVDDDPVNLVDSSGRDFWDCLVAILIFLLGYQALIDQIIGIGLGLIFFGLFLAVFIPILGIILVVVGFFGTIVLIIIVSIYLGRGLIVVCSG